MKGKNMKSTSTLKMMALVIAVMVALTGCSSTKAARDFNGLSSPDGQVIGHLSTSNIAVHLLVGKKPLWGDASLEKTVSDFTAAAKGEHAQKVRIVQSSSTAYWFLFFPFTLVFTPVVSNVAGEAIS